VEVLDGPDLRASIFDGFGQSTPGKAAAENLDAGGGVEDEAFCHLPLRVRVVADLCEHLRS
jgi:hypothetical protein